MATFNLCNQFDQIADGKVVYYGTEHTEYADLEQPEEEKPKKKFSGGSLFGKLVGALVTVAVVAVAVGAVVAYGASVVLTGGATLAALPAVAGVMVAGFTAYRGTAMVMDQYNQDKANEEEGSWGDYIGGALVNTVQIGAEEVAWQIILTPVGVVGGRVIGFAFRYGSKLFAGRAIGRTIGKWFGRGAGKAIGKEVQLLDELVKSGVKCTPEDVVAIIRNSEGKLIWLEKGNAQAGLEHIIIRHADDFAAKGIAKEEIKDVVMEALRQNRIVGRQGSRDVYEVVFKGKTQHIAITVSKNGYVVGANPHTIH